MVTSQQIDEIIKRIVVNAQPEKIILFGSYAKGVPHAASDIDLLIIKDSALPRYKRGREIRKHLRGLKIPIDLIVYTNAEIKRWRKVKTAFINTVLETGRVLYERAA